MADDKLSFMDEGEAVERGPKQPEPEQPEAEPAEHPEAEPEQPEPQEEQATGETQGEPPSPEPEEDQRAIPITALLEERERRQKAEREAEALRRWREEQLRKAQEAQTKPDFYEDPDRAIGHYVQPVQQQVMATKMQMSRFLAEREFGPETVNAAVEYFNDYPEMSHRFINEPSPFHAAVEYFKRQKFAHEVQDPDQWRQQERERIKAEIMAEMQSQQPSQPSALKAPPRSLASAQSTGRDATKPGSGFDRIFE